MSSKSWADEPYSDSGKGKKQQKSKGSKQKAAPKTKKPQAPALGKSIGQARVAKSQPGSPFYNPTNASHEVEYRVVDFFDLPDGDDSATPPNDITVVQYQFDVTSLFAGTSSESGAQATLSRIVEAEFFALPRFDLDTATSTIGIYYSCPMGISSSGGSGQGTTAAAAVQSTILTPTTVSDWVPIGKWNEQTIHETNQQLVVPETGGGIICGTVGTFDVDTLAGVSANVQIAVRLTIRQPVFNAVKAKVYRARGTSTNTVLYSEPDNNEVAFDGNVLLQPLRVVKTE